MAGVRQREKKDVDPRDAAKNAALSSLCRTQEFADIWCSMLVKLASFVTAASLYQALRPPEEQGPGAAPGSALVLPFRLLGAFLAANAAVFAGSATDGGFSATVWGPPGAAKLRLASLAVSVFLSALQLWLYANALHNSGRPAETLPTWLGGAAANSGGALRSFVLPANTWPHSVLVFVAAYGVVFYLDTQLASARALVRPFFDLDGAPAASKKDD